MGTGWADVRSARRIASLTMTEHEALQDQELSVWPIDGSWDDYPIAPAEKTVAVPWYRRPRLLLALIAVAAAALVVAAALLVTGDFSGDIPAGPQLDTRTAATASPTSAPPGSGSADTGSTGSVTSTSGPSTPSSSAEAPPSPEVTLESPQPAPPPPPVPPPTADGRQKEGPRINVTRTPMSFTPGQSGKS